MGALVVAGLIAADVAMVTYTGALGLLAGVALGAAYVYDNLEEVDLRAGEGCWWHEEGGPSQRKRGRLRFLDVSDEMMLLLGPRPAGGSARWR